MRFCFALLIFTSVFVMSESVAAEFHAGFGTRVITPEHFEAWEDRNGDAQYDPTAVRFKVSGRIDAGFLRDWQGLPSNKYCHHPTCSGGPIGGLGSVTHRLLDLALDYPGKPTAVRLNPSMLGHAGLSQVLPRPDGNLILSPRT